jgi:hypothetical protein
MPENGDRELARLFANLRRADAAATPPFRHVLERPRRRGLGAPRSLAAVSALTALAAVAVLAAFLLHAPALKTPGGNPPLSLAQWTSPTDFLLRTPGSELLEQPSPLFEPAPDYADFERSSSRPGASTPRPAHPSRKGERS